MAKDESKRLNPAIVESDRASFAALQVIQNYAPANPTYALSEIVAAQNELNAAQQA
jgi:hypothetical protein